MNLLLTYFKAFICLLLDKLTNAFKTKAAMRFIHLIAVFTVLTVCKALRFNKPRILLPVIDEVRVSYTLEVLEKGCFDFR